MSEQLYKRITTGKRVSYKPVEPEEPATVIEMSDNQMLTVAGALGITLLTLYERCLPPHKRVARKVKVLEEAVLQLYSGVGEQVDAETLEFFCKAWDGTMRAMTAGGGE